MKNDNRWNRPRGMLRRIRQHTCARVRNDRGTPASAVSFAILIASVAVCLKDDLLHADLPPGNTGQIYVGDYGDDEVAVYDGAGAYLRSFTAGGLNGTRGIVIAPDGLVYVASQLTHQIFVFDMMDNHVDTYSPPQLSSPTGMMMVGDELFVCSYGSDEVVVLHRDGTFLRSFSGGNLNGPNCAAVDSSGNIYVSSAITSTIVKFGPDESFIDEFTGGGLGSPMSIARDAGDAIYVSGGTSNNIVVFDTDGAVLDVISHSELTVPQGVAFDDRGHLFATSFNQNTVVEFDSNGSYVQTIAAGDLNIPRSLAFVPMILGDINDDGIVDVNDLLDLLGAWGPCPPDSPTCAADFDGSGDVSVNDLLILLGNWS